MTARPARPTRRLCDALAQRLGVTLEYRRTRRAKHVDIYVPPGRRR